MNILSDIKVLDSLLALTPTITLWSARRKMTLSDFGNAELPPEDLARSAASGLPIRAA